MTQIIGLDSFVTDMGAAAKEAKPIVERAALNMALAVRRLAQDKVAKKSTILAQSIIADPLPFGAMTTVNEKYGVYLEYGTGIYGPLHHVIYPTNGKVLAWEEEGEMHFARSTKGMREQPFFWPALEEAGPTIDEEMRKAADELISLAVGVA